MEEKLVKEEELGNGQEIVAFLRPWFLERQISFSMRKLRT